MDAARLRAIVQQRYKAEIDHGGCKRCGAGHTWTVVDRDDVACGESWGDKEGADDHADAQNEAAIAAVHDVLAELAQEHEAWLAQQSQGGIVPLHFDHGQIYARRRVADELRALAAALAE